MHGIEWESNAGTMSMKTPLKRADSTEHSPDASPSKHYTQHMAWW
ncbi:MAG: hypothetical protein ACI9CD_000133 [Candidatus Deianiraeaceae bacterium]|jgi:hypothetical protein